MLCFDGSHWRTRSFHVEGRRCATEHDRRARANDLCHRDTGQHIDAVKDQRADQRHRSDEAHECYGHNLDRYSGLDAVQQVLTGIFAEAKIAGCRNRENRHRLCDEVGPVRPKHLHHFGHARYAMLAKGTGNNRFFRGRQRHVKTPSVGHLRFDVLVGRKRRRQVGDVIKSVAQTGVFNEVCRIGKARFLRSVIKNLQSARSRHVVHIVAADFGIGITVAIEQRKRRGCIRNRFLDDIDGKQYSLCRLCRFSIHVQHALFHAGTADFHSDLSHQALGFVQNIFDLFVT